MGFFELLMHTLTWAFAFILTFNTGVILAIFVTIQARKKREDRQKEEK